MQDKKRLKIMTSQRNNDEYAGDSRWDICNEIKGDKEVWCHVLYIILSLIFGNLILSSFNWIIHGNNSQASFNKLLLWLKWGVIRSYQFL